MREPNSKRRTLSYSNSSKTAKQNKAARTTARKPVKLKRGTLSAVGQLHRSSAKQTERAESKQARILAMLRAPSGATIRRHGACNRVAAALGARFSRRRRPQETWPQSGFGGS
jgi:hypothetical protein